MRWDPLPTPVRHPFQSRRQIHNGVLLQVFVLLIKPQREALMKIGFIVQGILAGHHIVLLNTITLMVFTAEINRFCNSPKQKQKKQ